METKVVAGLAFGGVFTAFTVCRAAGGVAVVVVVANGCGASYLIDSVTDIPDQLADMTGNSAGAAEEPVAGGRASAGVAAGNSAGSSGAGFRTGGRPSAKLGVGG